MVHQISSEQQADSQCLSDMMKRGEHSGNRICGAHRIPQKMPDAEPLRPAHAQDLRYKIVAPSPPDRYLRLQREAIAPRQHLPRHRTSAAFRLTTSMSPWRLTRRQDNRVRDRCEVRDAVGGSRLPHAPDIRKITDRTITDFYRARKPPTIRVGSSTSRQNRASRVDRRATLIRA